MCRHHSHGESALEPRVCLCERERFLKDMIALTE